MREPVPGGMHHVLLLLVLASCTFRVGSSPGTAAAPSPPPSEAEPEPGPGAVDDEPRSAAPTGRAIAFFDQGALAYHDDRLHFTAFVGGLPTKSMPPPTVQLIAAGKVVASIPLFAHDAWPNVFICRGVSAFRMTDYPSYAKDCSFPGLSAGRYTLAIQHAGRRIAEKHLTLVENRFVDGKRFLIVKPSDRTEQGYVNSVRIVYWHQIDARDQTEVVELIWMNGDIPERPPTHAHSEHSRAALAKGGPLWESDTPLVDVVPIQGPAPHADWTNPNLRLLVFREATQLIATHRIVVVEPGQVGILAPATDVTEKQIRIARAEAKDVHREDLHDDHTWPEVVVCDVASNPRRLADLYGWVNHTRGAEVRMQLSREDERASKETWRTDEERRELAERAKARKQGAHAKAGFARKSEGRTVKGLGDGFKKGCFEKLAPVR